MLPDFMTKYLVDIEAAIRKLKDVYVEYYEEEIVTANRVNLRIRLRFTNGHLLELNEAFIGEEGTIRFLGYRYHFQDGQNNIVFRYDNTPHFHELEHFPHHKHLSDKIVGTAKPSILKAIDEARLLVNPEP